MSTTIPTDGAGTGPAQAAEELNAGLAAADARVKDGAAGLQRIHQARLSQATRSVATLTAQYGADDPRVTAAQAYVAATQSAVARVALMCGQFELPAVQVSAAGWTLQGRVVDAKLQALARHTVFIVDERKAFLRQYGFAYTDAQGRFALSYAGADPTAPAPAASSLFIEVANTAALPVYLAATPFEPVAGAASYVDVVLPAGAKPIGDPPVPIREIALPPAKGKAS